MMREHHHAKELFMNIKPEFRDKRSGFPTQQDVKSQDFIKPRLWPRLIIQGTDLTDLVSLKGSLSSLNCSYFSDNCEESDWVRCRS